MMSLKGAKKINAKEENKEKIAEKKKAKHEEESN